MSQAKVDQRKKSNGEALHNAKKTIKTLTGVICLIVVAAIALAFVFNKLGYKKGDDAGYQNGYADGYYDGYNKAKETTTAAENATKDEKATENSTKDEKATEESTKDEKATEEATKPEKETEASTEATTKAAE